MCSKTSLEAVLAEQRSNLNGLITQTQQLEVQQDKLAEDARHTSSLLRDLRREHRDLLKDFTQLREEFCAVRDCLTAANVVTKPAVNRNLSRRRAPMVLKKVLEEPGLSLTFGSIAGVVGCLRVRETSKGLCGGISTCLPLLRKRMPPEIYVLGVRSRSRQRSRSVERPWVEGSTWSAAMTGTRCSHPQSGLIPRRALGVGFQTCRLRDPAALQYPCEAACMYSVAAHATAGQMLLCPLSVSTRPAEFGRFCRLRL